MRFLGVIASSPTDIQPVLDVVAANAARLCGANDASDPATSTVSLLRSVASFRIDTADRGLQIELSARLDRTAWTRAMLERQTVHIHDLAAAEHEFPESRHTKRSGVRTMLIAPLLREGIAIGLIIYRRD